MLFDLTFRIFRCYALNTTRSFSNAFKSRNAQPASVDHIEALFQSLDRSIIRDRTVDSQDGISRVENPEDDELLRRDSSTASMPLANWQQSLLETRSIQMQAHESFSSTDTSLQELKSENFLLSTSNFQGAEDSDSSGSPMLLKEDLEQISMILQGEEDHNLLERIWQVSRNVNVIPALPPSTFVEILRRLDPGDEFLAFKTGYAQRIPKHYHSLMRSVEDQMRTLMRRRRMYTDLCEQRIKSGRDLKLREYTQLLKCARATYDGHTAAMIMRTMSLRDVLPDLACYNAFFEARCWSDTWCPHERHFLRVIPFSMRERERKSTNWLGGYKNIVHPHMVGPEGLKKEVTEVFAQMNDNGILADSEAFGHLITALGREGDLDGVKAVLNNAWDIDVDANGQSHDRATTVSNASPLAPDGRTLFVVAHAFGSNNDISTALKVVDIMSRKYSIEISANVWAELLSWTYVLSTPRHKRRKGDKDLPGQVIPDSTEQLFKRLTGEPYHCQATLPMYDHLIRSLRRRNDLPGMLCYIKQALDMLRLEQHPLRSSSGLDVRSHSYHYLEKRSTRLISFAYVHRWFGLLLAGHRFRLRRRREPPKSGTRFWWQRQVIPDIIDIFWRFRDKKGVGYSLNTGYVLLQELTGDPE